jgi:hypothetical protein
MLRSVIDIDGDRRTLALTETDQRIDGHGGPPHEIRIPTTLIARGGGVTAAAARQRRR